ncbi:MAG: HD domain-containing response regulator [Clostridiales bacterium]|nr:HD domain-containing response regulator [Clostridiales bacterium]
MRKNKAASPEQEFSILTLDDDKIMTLTLQSYFQALGFHVDMENDPFAAIERIRAGRYDILLLDFLMRPINGDEVVRQVRKFNKDIFIILLTGHKSMAPPLKAIRELDIQGYYEKSDRFDQLELLVESCAKSIRQMRIIRGYRDGLSSILEKIPALSRLKNMEKLLLEVMDQVKELTGWQEGLIYLDFSAIGADKLLKSGRSCHFTGCGSFEGQEALGVKALAGLEQFSDFFVQDGEKLHIAPLSIESGTAFGVLLMRGMAAKSEDTARLFAVYAKQAGAVIGSMVYQSILEVQNTELNQAYMETIDLMRKMVDAKDYYTRGHSDRVSYYSVLIARAMGMDDAFVERIRIGGLFHDIGKIGVPDAILRKPARLTDEEYATIKEHPALGKKLLLSLSSFHDILPMVESHHEWYNGRGYPKGLAGEQISLEARIISVADSFDAMTSKRTYRDSLSIEEAVKELIRGKNSQFDPVVVDIFTRIISTKEDILAGAKDIFPDNVA